MDYRNFRFSEVVTEEGILFVVGVPDEVEDTDLFLDKHLNDVVSWGEAN